MQTQFKAYTFSTKDWKRLAIFAEVVDDNLEFFILKCSPFDNFEKRKAQEIYDLYREKLFSYSLDGKIVISRIENKRVDKKIVQEMVNYHPEIFKVKIEDITKPRKTFLTFCNKSFYRISVESYQLEGVATIKTLVNNL